MAAVTICSNFGAQEIKSFTVTIVSPSIGGSDGLESACNGGDPDLIPGSERSPWRREWQPTPALLPEKVPWIEELGRLQSVRSQRVGQ